MYPTEFLDKFLDILYILYVKLGSKIVQDPFIKYCYRSDKCKVI